MASPQTGIFALGTSSHAYLELDVAASADPADVVARVAGLREPRTTIGGVNLVAGFRPELWAAVAPDAAPAGVTGFETPRSGPTGYTLPAAQHDIVDWIAGAGYDVVFDMSRQVTNALAGHAALAHEMVGWPYHHDLDLTGFIDGTENPSLVDAMAVAIVPVPPPGSHVARTDQERFGRIFRRNIAYGSVADHGTIFVGFSATQQVLEGMLDSMIGRTGEVADELTHFTRPITGAYYVLPSADRLASLAGS